MWETFWHRWGYTLLCKGETRGKHWTPSAQLTWSQRRVSRQQIAEFEAGGDVFGLLPQPELLALHHHGHHGDGIFEAGHGDKPSVGVHLFREVLGGRGEHLAAAARLLQGPRSQVCFANGRAELRYWEVFMRTEKMTYLRQRGQVPFDWWKQNRDIYSVNSTRVSLPWLMISWLLTDTPGWPAGCSNSSSRTLGLTQQRPINIAQRRCKGQYKPRQTRRSRCPRWLSPLSFLSSVV